MMKNTSSKSVTAVKTIITIVALVVYIAFPLMGIAPQLAFAKSDNHNGQENQDQNNQENDNNGNHDSDNNHDLHDNDDNENNDNDNDDDNDEDNGGGVPNTNATISATKIVCDSESDLPNWGAGGADITSSTATDFLASNPNCHLESGWNFQWAPENPASIDPGGSFIGEAGSPWTTFGTTNVSGVAMTTVDTLTVGAFAWVREVLKDGYIPFTFDQSNQSNENDVSAEIYCSNDVLNYDNLDLVSSPAAGGTYYCVAFNALKPVIPATPQCSDNKDNDEDGLTDAEDPACHTDKNVNNSGSYDPNLNDESDNLSNQCADGKDNDGDEKIDSTDPGCHTNGNPDDNDSYDPAINDETDPNLPQCSDFKDNDGDQLIDAADPGCHSDGDASVGNTYNAALNDESATNNSGNNSGGGSGGGSETGGGDGGGGGTSGGGSGGGGEALGNGPILALSSHGGGNGPIPQGRVLGTQTSCGAYINSYIRFGKKNDAGDVIKLQKFLNERENSNLPVTGFYGEETLAAVHTLQKKYGLEILAPWVSHGLKDAKTSTGYVYKTTKRWINNVACPSLMLPMPQLP